MSIDPFVSVPMSALCDPEVPLDVPRDRYKRPLIRQLDDTLAPYTRISTVAGWLSDGYGLGVYRTRHAVLSVARNEDLAAMIAPLSYGDKQLDQHIEAACERSVQMVTARNWGTAVHSFTEADSVAREAVPARMRADVASYDDALAGADLKLVESEVFVVNDEMRVAGTLDGLYLDGSSGYVVVGDKKTGALKPMQVAAQLAMYHGGQRYDPVSGVRTPLSLRLDPLMLLVAHIAKGTGTTALWRIVMHQARPAAQLALALGQLRSKESAIVTSW